MSASKPLNNDKRKLIIYTILGVLCFLAVLYLSFSNSMMGLSGVLTVILINIIIVLGLNLIIGVAGQLSLGHAAFVSIGAYTSAILMMKVNIPFGISIIIAAMVAGIVGGLFGLSVIRLRGDYFAIATLGFCEIVRVLIANMTVTIHGETKLLSVNLVEIPGGTSLLLVFILVVASIIFMYRLEQSKFGLALRSIREDEIAAQMMGVNISKYRVLAFAIGSAFAGLGGALHASNINSILPSDFGFIESIGFLSMLVLGGMGSIVGVIAGTTVLAAIPEVLREASSYRMIIYGTVLIFMMVFRPKGLFGNIKVNV